MDALLKDFTTRNPSKRAFMLCGAKGTTFMCPDGTLRTIQEYLQYFLMGRDFDTVSFYNENNKLYALDEKSARYIINNQEAVTDASSNFDYAGAFDDDDMFSVSDDEAQEVTNEAPANESVGEVAYSKPLSITGLNAYISKLIDESNDKRHALIIDGPNLLLHPEIRNNVSIFERLNSCIENSKNSIIIFLVSEDFVIHSKNLFTDIYHGYFLDENGNVDPSSCLVYSYERIDEIVTFFTTRYAQGVVTFNDPKNLNSEIELLADEIIYCRSKRLEINPAEKEYVYLFRFLDEKINEYRKTDEPLCITPKLIDEFFELEESQKRGYEIIKCRRGWEAVNKVLNPIVEAGNKALKEKRERTARENKYQPQGVIKFVNRLSGINVEVRVNGLPIPCFAVEGNPGTGKTTVATNLGSTLKESGYLESGHLVHVSAADLTAGYVGQSYTKTINKLNEAEGGVLVIDEVGQLAVKKGEEGHTFNKDVINTLVHALTDKSRHFCLVICGYEEEVKSFLDSDKGLNRRIQYKIKIDDFDSDTLKNVFLTYLDENGIIIPDDEEIIYNIDKMFDNIKRIEDQRVFGNAGGAQNMAKEVVSRIHSDNRDTFTLDDLGEMGFYTDYYVQKRLENNRFEKWLDEAFKNLVGLEDVKERLLGLKDALLRDPSYRFRSNQNYLVLGPAGVGKTTVVNLISQALYQLGARKRIGNTDTHNKIIPITKDDLFTTSYVNDAKDNINKYIKSSLGGTLFIDEAYQLVCDNELSGEHRGEDVLDALMSAASEENHQFSTSFILAGYRNDMQKVIDNNPGFQRRFPEHNHIVLQPYPIDQLVNMFESKTRGRLKLTQESKRYLVYLLTLAKTNDDNSNAGYIQNIVDMLEAHFKTGNGEKLVELEEFKNAMFPMRARSKEEYIKKVDEAFCNLYGVDRIKEKLIEIYDSHNKTVEYYVKGKLNSIGDESYNITLLGAPGAGKTVMAQAISKCLCYAGIRNDKFVATTASEFKSNSTLSGNISKLFDRCVKEARGGTLFIDEAHNLQENEFVISLLRYSETLRASTSIIIAGYDDDMVVRSGQCGVITGLIDRDEGLSRRFPEKTRIRIAYTPQELTSVAINYFKERMNDVAFDDDFEQDLALYIEQNAIETPGPLIRSYCSDACINYLDRCECSNENEVLSIADFN